MEVRKIYLVGCFFFLPDKILVAMMLLSADRSNAHVVQPVITSWSNYVQYTVQYFGREKAVLYTLLASLTYCKLYQKNEVVQLPDYYRHVVLHIKLKHISIVHIINSHSVVYSTLRVEHLPPTKNSEQRDCHQEYGIHAQSPACNLVTKIRKSFL